MHKLIILVTFLLVTLFSVGCTSKPTDQSSTTEPVPTAATTKTTTKSNRPMMGQDSFGVSVCEDLPQDIVEAAIGKPIVETTDNSTQTGTGCTYYTDKDKRNHILVQVSYLSAENQKQGQESLGRTTTTSPLIPMDHFIVMQEDGQINAIYLIIAPEKFVRVDRTASAASNDQLIELAGRITNAILGNK